MASIANFTQKLATGLLMGLTLGLTGFLSYGVIIGVPEKSKELHEV